MSGSPAGDTQSPPISQPARPPRRDNLPPWVVVLLVLFVAVRAFDVGIAPFLSHTRASKAETQSGQGLDTDSMEDLVATDLYTKVAFAASGLNPGTVVTPEKEYIKTALTSAIKLQKESDNDPGAARRVILVRFLAGSATPLLPGRHGLDPLAAFTTALPPDLPPQDRRTYAAEAGLWREIFQTGRLSPDQVEGAAREIESLPHIHWWRYPALMALYKSQGDLSEENRVAGEARDAVVPSILGVSVLMLLRLAFVLLGIVIFVYLLAVGVNKANGNSVSLWRVVPEHIPLENRKLGAGDLMGVFMIYLLTREVIGVALTGYSGFGASHLLTFSGLLTPLKPRIDDLPEATRSLIGIVLEAVVYVVSAVPPLIALSYMARSRGASIADELGWSKRSLGANMGYGVAGFAISSALILPVALLAEELFRRFPSPSNPVIPQLIDAPGFWAAFILVILASFAAPPIEELLFRGVFYNAAKLRLGAWPAIVLTGLVFGFVHPVGVAEMLAIGTLGGVFAWMAETRKSLVPSMTAHFLQNFTTILLLLAALQT